MSFTHRIEALLDAGRVKRLHTIPTLMEHNDAQHVYGSMVIAAELLVQNDEVNALAVMTYLLYHDAPEVSTGDAPAPVKMASPAIRKEYQMLEEIWYVKLGIVMPELEPTDELLAKTCDTLDLAFNMLHELRMGSRHPRINEVLSNCLSYTNPAEALFKGVKDIRDHIKKEWTIYGHR